ncbi:hypothetical protein GCM10027423_21950 [Spirosoma arcticum]
MDDDLVTGFLEGLFGPGNEVTRSPVVAKIYNTELALEGGKSRDLSTLTHGRYRSHPYKSEPDRRRLREQIVQELLLQKRLADDDAIQLGVGGALLYTRCKHKRQAYIITGLPASGKSGIAAKVADKLGAAIIDSDYAKRKLPEYDRSSFGASLMHRESGAIVLGDGYLNQTDFKTLFDYFSEKGTNVVLPKIGDTVESVLKLVNKLKTYNYDVHLTLISLDRKKATIRAVNRFDKTDRYVPLSLIYDVYANEPILTYYRLKESHRDIFKSIGKLSTDVPMGQPYQFLESDGENPALLFKQKIVN